MCSWRQCSDYEIRTWARFGSQIQDVHSLVTFGDSFFLGHIGTHKLLECDLKITYFNAILEKHFTYDCVKTCLNIAFVRLFRWLDEYFLVLLYI